MEISPAALHCNIAWLIFNWLLPKSAINGDKDTVEGFINVGPYHYTWTILLAVTF